MNIIDLIDSEYGLLPSEHDGALWGRNKACEIIEWSGRTHREKIYILKCSECSKDPELWGDAHFKSTLGNLKQGKVGCGCSLQVRWSASQYTILCRRYAEESNYIFKGILGFPINMQSKVSLICPIHGEFNNLNINRLFMGAECTQCCNKSDEDLINEFIELGGFSENSEFWRSDRKTKQGGKSYWWIKCAACGDVSESFIANLKKGHVPCRCGINNQKEAYINTISDKELVIALKFGIANDSYKRLSDQRKKSAFEVSSFGVWKFEDAASCRSAERKCKDSLDCGTISKRDFEDGWTETTHTYNLENIIKIYEDFGGVKWTEA